jgi:hypothetical protein
VTPTEDGYEYAVAILESPNYMGAAELQDGLRILCGPCSWAEAMRFIDEAVKDGGVRERYKTLVHKVEPWKEYVPQ